MTSIIVACDPNRVIGTASNTIPWNLPEDMRFFKETTCGHPIIMGRNTWDSLPRKPLPKRTNIVVSRTMTPSSDGDTVGSSKPIIVSSLKEAIEMVSTFHMAEPYIIGGAQIYKAALEQGLVDKLLITQVHKAYEGTVYFPDPADYEFVQSNVIKEHPDFDIIEYQNHGIFRNH
jgi:dihydrofolate reductase